MRLKQNWRRKTEPMLSKGRIELSLLIALLFPIVYAFLINVRTINRSVRVSPEEVAGTDGGQLKTQMTHTRTWHEILLRPALTVESPRGGFISPFRVKVDLDGYIYVLDPGRPALLKFSPSGKFVYAFGKGKGKGPGELERPHDFDIGSNGNVYICDASTGVITIFGKNGKVISSVRPTGYPQHIAVFSDGRFVVQRIAYKNIFQVYDLKGVLIRQFGRVTPTSSEGIAFPILDFIVVASDTNLYSIGMNVGLILCYSEKGDEKYGIESIDKIPLPGGTIEKATIPGKSATIVRPDKPSLLSDLDASIAGSKIYALALKASKEEKAVVVDLYNTSDGSYIESLKFNKPEGTDGILSLVVNDKNLYTVEMLKDGSYAVRKYTYTVQ